MRPSLSRRHRLTPRATPARAAASTPPPPPPAPVRAPAPAPASLARLYVAAAPRSSVQTASAAAGVLRFRPRGALSALLFLLATAAAAYAAARRLVAANTRSCDCCRGFGAVRCSLCRGAGTVAYEGKYVHAGDACPKCLGARCVACPECGGLFARRLFAHSREPRVGAAAASAAASGDANDRRGWFGYGAQQTLLD